MSNNIISSTFVISTFFMIILGHGSACKCLESLSKQLPFNPGNCYFSYSENCRTVCEGRSVGVQGRSHIFFRYELGKEFYVLLPFFTITGENKLHKNDTMSSDVLVMRVRLTTPSLWHTISGLSLCGFLTLCRGYFSRIASLGICLTSMQVIPSASCAPGSHVDCRVAARDALYAILFQS